MLRLSSSGHLLPWIGPALRGLVAERFKEAVCRQPAELRASRWKVCKGCPFLAECAYGELFEPDPPADADVFQGQEESVRPVVLAPYFPVPTEAQRGLEIPLRIVLVGPHAGDDAKPLLQMIANVGGQRGLGPDHVTFDVLPNNGSDCRTGELRAADLPAHPAAVSGVLPRVGIGLVAPLLLRSRQDDGRRRANVCPELVDLVRPALRTISHLFRLYGEPLEADFRALKAAAEGIRLVEHCYEPFQQRKWSSRTEHRFCIHGVVGGGVYADVPLALLPWLVWGGRLHVGNHRVAGAGGWRVVLD
jgi:hypothetical protein